MLIAAGASAVNPYLAIDQVRALADDGAVNVDPVVAQENYRSALQTGLLKVMSKMGICTVSAYRGFGALRGHRSQRGGLRSGLPQCSAAFHRMGV